MGSKMNTNPAKTHSFMSLATNLCMKTEPLVMIGPGLPVLDRVAIYWPTCANTTVFEQEWHRMRRHGLSFVDTAPKECAARVGLRCLLSIFTLNFWYWMI